MFHVPWPRRAGRRDELSGARDRETGDASRIVRVVPARRAKRYAGLFDRRVVGQGSRRHSCVFAIAPRAQTGKRVSALEPLTDNRGRPAQMLAAVWGHPWSYVRLWREADVETLAGRMLVPFARVLPLFG